MARRSSAVAEKPRIPMTAEEIRAQLAIDARLAPQGKTPLIFPMIGGIARSLALTRAQRSAIGLKGALVRAANYKRKRILAAEEAKAALNAEPKPKKTAKAAGAAAGSRIVDS